MKICEKCKKVFRNTYDLNRHSLRKKPCEEQIEPIKNNKKDKTDASGTTIVIINFGQPDANHINKKHLQKIFNQFDTKQEPIVETGEALIKYKELLNLNQVNRNVKVSTKSSSGKIKIGNQWVPKLKETILNQVTRQTARSMSDRIDIIGDMSPPDELVENLETIVMDGLILETRELQRYRTLLTLTLT